MKCPNCGSENCHYVTKTETSGSFFSGIDACCGFLFLGPAGLLCGLCGSGVSSETKEYWICDNCGKKFKAKEAQKNINGNKQLSFYYDDPKKYPEKANQIIVKAMDRAFEQTEYYRDFLNKIIIRKEEFEKNRQLFQKNLERVSSNELIVFAYHDYEKIIVTWRAIYLEDKYETWGEIKSISIWENAVYFNQTAVEFSSQTARDSFLSIINYIIPEVKIYTPPKYEDLLRRLQNLPEENSSQNCHFSSKKEYAFFIDELLEKKVREYRITNDEKYQQYLRIRQEKETKEKQVGISVLEVGAIIGICSLIVAGFWKAILIFIVVECIGLIGAAYYLSRDEWNAYRKELLPDLLICLIDEQERSNIKKTGKIKVADYEIDFGTLIPNREV